MKANWRSLKNLGNSKVVASNSIWSFIIPTAGQGVEYLNELLPKSFGAPELVLPFNWKLLFLSSLCFFAASLIYRARCPKIVKEQNDFGVFLEQSRTPQQIINYYIDCVEKPFSKLSKKELIEFLTNIHTPELTSAEKSLVFLNEKSGQDAYYVDNSELAKLFWFVYEACNRNFYTSYLASFIFFCLGFVFLAGILFMNIQFALFGL